MKGLPKASDLNTLIINLWFTFRASKYSDLPAIETGVMNVALCYVSLKPFFSRHVCIEHVLSLNEFRCFSVLCILFFHGMCESEKELLHLHCCKCKGFQDTCVTLRNRS